MSKTVDPELKALERCVAALTSLDGDGAQRVLTYLRERIVSDPAYRTAFDAMNEKVVELQAEQEKLRQVRLEATE